MSLEIRAVPFARDNYAWLLTDPQTGAVAVVDPGEAAPVIDVIGKGRLDLILLTHHHDDHIGGAETLRRKYGARIAGAEADQARLPPLDLLLHDEDRIAIGHDLGEVIATPGHARGHIAFYFRSVPALFCGDTLFSLGCGRLLEGTAQELFDSLRRFDSLPDETLICCGHEYTASNAAFALAHGPDTMALKQRAQEVNALRAQGRPTVPVTLGLERQTNLFLRARDVAEFAALRRAKDNF
ncbi:hydroxyacylglutathione hydrolase [Asaia krungthepensis]|uniref:Hydroxyacylglutathione hydrolase n=1 Tax=Asaia krungthepensis NRIC 0535 TaxID=1307925 RepID=A0ABQ0PYB3_9PROT|nr:hydroxyacylglutathione hydrolase [Asaia krungthepensis]GBQ84662.1 hydroxyacylglutathione hydrolase [Asaia krungthepensis NRIC 0535]